MIRPTVRPGVRRRRLRKVEESFGKAWEYLGKVQECRKNHMYDNTMYHRRNAGMLGNTKKPLTIEIPNINTELLTIIPSVMLFFVFWLSAVSPAVS